MKLYVFIVFQIVFHTRAQNAELTSNRLQKSIIETFGAIAAIKSENENTLAVDTEFLAKFYVRFNTYRNELFTALEENIFKEKNFRLNDTKVLNINNEQMGCAGPQKDGVAYAKTLGRNIFDNCQNNVNINFAELNNTFVTNKEKIFIAFNRTDSLLTECKLSYTNSYDLQAYDDCVQSTKGFLVDATVRYKTSVRDQIKDVIIALAECTDLAVYLAESVLRELHTDIIKCYSYSSKPINKDLVIPILSKYNDDLSSVLNLKEELTSAINSLQNKSAQVLQETIAMNASLVIPRAFLRSTGRNDIQDRLELLDEVNKRRWAIKQAEKYLLYYNATYCAAVQHTDTTNRLNDNSREVTRCVINSKVYQLIPNFVNLQFNIKGRLVENGLIGVMNCFADSKNTLKKGVTACCAKETDEAIQQYASRADTQRKLYLPLLAQIDEEFYKCQEKVILTTRSQLEYNKNRFQSCVNNLNINYTLKY